MKRLLVCLSMLTSAACAAQSAENRSHSTIDPDAAYKNNCMRCHTATQQYSTRMTKTIVMHMRVRANLPEDQARAILAYLNGESEPLQTPAKQPAAESSHQGRK